MELTPLLHLCNFSFALKYLSPLLLCLLFFVALFHPFPEWWSKRKLPDFVRVYSFPISHSTGIRIWIIKKSPEMVKMQCLIFFLITPIFTFQLFSDLFSFIYCPWAFYICNHRAQQHWLDLCQEKRSRVGRCRRHRLCVFGPFVIFHWSHCCWCGGGCCCCVSYCSTNDWYRRSVMEFPTDGPGNCFCFLIFIFTIALHNYSFHLCLWVVFVELLIKLWLFSSSASSLFHCRYVLLWLLFRMIDSIQRPL